MLKTENVSAIIKIKVLIPILLLSLSLLELPKESNPQREILPSPNNEREDCSSEDNIAFYI